MESLVGLSRGPERKECTDVHGLKKWNANNDVYFRTALYRKSQLLRWL
jgi:hypothetical protein